MWVLVDPNKPIGERTFAIVGTGYPMPDDIPMTYLDTVQIRSFVWHVFEVG